VGQKIAKLYILTLRLKFKSNYNKLGRIEYENLWLYKLSTDQFKFWLLWEMLPKYQEPRNESYLVFKCYFVIWSLMWPSVFITTVLIFVLVFYDLHNYTFMLRSSPSLCQFHKLITTVLIGRLMCHVVTMFDEIWP
jgi:hypothetical protein